MNLSFDTVIVGSGVGGAAVAAALCSDGSFTDGAVLVVDAGAGRDERAGHDERAGRDERAGHDERAGRDERAGPAESEDREGSAGRNGTFVGTRFSDVYPTASSIGSGISSPLMSRRARPVWRMESAVSALKHLMDITRADALFSKKGILKLALSEEQAAHFKDAAGKWPVYGQWIDTMDAGRRWPAIHAPFGALHVSEGTSVSLPAWSEHLIRYATSRGAHCMTDARMLSWTERGPKITVRIRVGRGKNGRIEGIDTSRLILALGADYLRFAELAALNLHPIKGQWALVECPHFEDDVIPVSGAGYVVEEKRIIDEKPFGGQKQFSGQKRFGGQKQTKDSPGLSLGSTFEHAYRHLRTDRGSLSGMISNAAQMIPAVEQSRVLASGAAIRVTVPGIRLPMVGPLRRDSNVWIFTGLGSKGILMAPMLALELPDYFSDPGSIPKEIRVTYRL